MLLRRRLDVRQQRRRSRQIARLVLLVAFLAALLLLASSSGGCCGDVRRVEPLRVRRPARPVLPEPAAALGTIRRTADGLGWTVEPVGSDWREIEGFAASGAEVIILDAAAFSEVVTLQRAYLESLEAAPAFIQD